eukprot:14739020-Alexandrium_andersonii.AAC.1
MAGTWCQSQTSGVKGGSEEPGPWPAHLPAKAPELGRHWAPRQAAALAPSLAALERSARGQPASTAGGEPAGTG